MIEDNFPEKFRAISFHPSLFIYAWKRNNLDKLFEEVMAGNIAILGGEAWVVSEDQSFGIIPLRDGSRDVLSWKISLKKGEQWYDFVERSVKETLRIIAEKDLELKVSNQVKKRIYYHFEFEAENG